MFVPDLDGVATPVEDARPPALAPSFIPFRRATPAGSGPPKDRSFLTHIVVPTFAVGLTMAAVLATFLLFAARKADDLAAGRQQQLIAAVVSQNIFAVAHDQEASTVWDESVTHVHAPVLDLTWLDKNLGVWLHSYYGHDESYIVTTSDKPIYAVRGGVRVSPAIFDRAVARVALPLAAELRRKLRLPFPTDHDARLVSPGAVDLARIAGHPAIVSVKPIISDTGKISRPAGSEYLHISIRYLDGAFMADLARQYGLQGAHFARHAPRDSHQRMVALRTRAGAPLGFFVWTPFRPGSLMIGQLTPAMAAVIMVVAGLFALLLRRIRKSTLELKAANAQSHHLAFHDVLTGLANRAFFDERLTRDMALMRRNQMSLAVLLIDLDHFKKINDSLGHPTGDSLIKALGGVLLRTAGPHDLVARIGGDEFAVIHCAPDAAMGAEALCRRIIAAVEHPFELAEGRIHGRLSIGVATAPDDAIERVDLVRKADMALYDAKLAGRGRYHMFVEAMDSRRRDRMAIERDLQAAIAAGDQLEVYYQPFFSSQTMQITGVEALVRWHHPKRGLMLPSAFVPIAEESGLIEELGEWVLEQSCLAALHWPAGPISVNVSAVQLRNPAFANKVFAILKRTRLDATRLELEITETSFIESTDQCRTNLGQLRDIGVRMALDDFGTGYSSFKHLHDFEVDRIKIDHMFVSSINLTTGGSSVIRAIVDLAKANGMQTTAEGVETEEQRNFLASIGCNSLQGFLLSRPLTLAELDRLMINLGG
ncbi:MAG: bifunctional diguanylate cyclase/phosphodiesterase [Rhizorhabdus sp.]|nr:bifunctional diguanylate cyclase/phosphodiesterase [Rhizorhabdus sp.]